MKTISNLSAFLIAILFFSCEQTVVQSSTTRRRASTLNDFDCTPFAQRVTIASSSYTKDSAWLQLPCDYNNLLSITKKYPLLIFFDGTGETSNHGNLDLLKILGPPRFITDSVRYEFSPDGFNTYDVIIIAPQSKTGYRSATSTNRIIDEMIKNFRIDTSRIYLTGLSSGGQSVYNYLTEKQEYANRIAAAIPMSSLELDPVHKANLKFITNANVAIKSFCGIADYLYKANQNYVDSFNFYKPGIASLTGYPGKHCCWNTLYEPSHNFYTPNMYEWMLNYHR